MVTVNQSRSETEHKINRATDDAEMIGFNDEGLACVWHGGVGFSVYDAARDWQEVRNFTSRRLHLNVADSEREQAARDRMMSEGFSPIN